MADKFKVGDQVKRVSSIAKNPTLDESSAYVIVKVDGDSYPWVNDKNGDIDCIYDEDWELAHIVDSPLYKALG